MFYANSNKNAFFILILFKKCKNESTGLNTQPVLSNNNASSKALDGSKIVPYLESSSLKPIV